jgi:Domain of unknown function (DUF4421)
MIKSYCILVFLVLIHAVIHAQVADSSKMNEPESEYIESMNNYLAIKLSLNNNISGFILKSNVTYEIQPNDINVLRLSINYRVFSFSYGYSAKFIPGNDDDQLKGKTAVSSYNLSFNFDHWIQSLNYEKVKGYYLQNTGDFIPGWKEGVDPYVQFPELIYNSYRGQTAYKFNKNFSFNSLSTQTERQLKNAGTLMPVLSYNYYIVNDKTVLTGQNSSQKSNNFEALLSLSYFYTLIIHKNFYLSPGVAAGGGMIYTKLLTRTPTGELITKSNSPVFRFEGFGALGYNAERLFIGAQFLISRESFKQQGTTALSVNNRLIYQVFTGYRFNSPRFLRKTVDHAEKKLPSF